MQLVLDLWDWSSEAAVAVSRTSQAAVIEYVDRAMHLPMTGSHARSAVYAACDDVVTRYLEEPSLLAERPYSLFNELSALHQQFVQRLIDVVASEKQPPAAAGGLANVVPLHPGRSVTAAGG